ncbi:taurine ABC transporter permease, partial [Burkholderia pseudomallei]|nr:taurine ABC transporter permease [Burkholderia pseudomallei]
MAATEPNADLALPLPATHAAASAAARRAPRVHAGHA